MAGERYGMCELSLRQPVKKFHSSFFITIKKGVGVGRETKISITVLRLLRGIFSSEISYGLTKC
jgi:hypothetical protein